MDFYSYNGVELPALPEWAKTEYPYAIIEYNKWLNRYELKRLKEIHYNYNSSAGINDTLRINANEKKYCATFNEGENAWSEGYYTSADTDTAIFFTDILWSNFDIISEDGSIYLAASKPIPVGYGIISLADYEAACDAIRAKTGKTDKIKSGDMAAEIETIIAESHPEYYKYNGVTLPKIPEEMPGTNSTAWAVVTSDNWNTAESTKYSYLFVGKYGFMVEPDDSDETVKYLRSLSGCAYWRLQNGKDKWLVGGIYSATRFRVTDDHTVVWANHDVPYTEDGSVYFPKSEPIKVE